MKKFRLIFLSTLLLPVGLIIADENEDAAAIRDARLASNQAIAAHDADRVASFWDEEYLIAISSGDLEFGREIARKSFARHFEDVPDVVYVRTPSEIIVSEDYPLAWEQGEWVGSMTNEKGYLEKGGTYAAGWRKVDGSWKIRSELFVAIHCSGPGC